MLTVAQSEIKFEVCLLTKVVILTQGKWISIESFFKLKITLKNLFLEIWDSELERKLKMTLHNFLPYVGITFLLPWQMQRENRLWSQFFNLNPGFTLTSHMTLSKLHNLLVPCISHLSNGIITVATSERV